MRFTGFEIVAQGLGAQRLRMRVAARNLAQARVTASDGRPPEPWAVVLRTTAAGGVVAERVARPGARPRYEYDPDHPHANVDGFVAYPDIDPLTELLDAMDAGQLYRANLNAFEAVRAQIEATLELGR